jgi:hypothetical protein
MEAQTFNEILERRIELIISSLSKKAKEYAPGENDTRYDRLHNFSRAAEVLRTSREKALVGMLIKHLVSILDIVDRFNSDPPSIETIEEKIGDSINYLILLEACMKQDTLNLVTKELVGRKTNFIRENLDKKKKIKK